METEPLNELKFVADNRGSLTIADYKHSRVIFAKTKRHVFKGMHFQFPNWEEKTILVVAGVIEEFMIDLDFESPSFGAVSKFTVDCTSSPKSFVVPRKYGHGYLTISDEASIIYLIDEPFHGAQQRSVFVKKIIDALPEGAIIGKRDLEAPILEDIDWHAF